MSYIVFLSTKGLQMVQGNVSKNNIHISSYKEFEFVETNLIEEIVNNVNCMEEKSND